MIRQVSTTKDMYEYALEDRLKIFIGRNAKANDALVRRTLADLRESKLQAYWMHLDDQTSAHGVVTVMQPASKSELVEACKFVKEWLLTSKVASSDSDVVLCKMSDVSPTKNKGCVVCKNQVKMRSSAWTKLLE